jgi:hypothetical protein
MDKLGLSPLDLLGVIGPFGVIAPMVLWLLVIGPLVLYPIARWRAGRDAAFDPQLGIKVALHYFRTLALHTLLLGVVLLIWTIISRGGDKSASYRTAFGFIVPGALVFGVHVRLLARTNDSMFIGVRRLFTGYNLVTTGLLGFTAVVLAFEALFAKGSSGDTGRLFLAAMLVYGPAWAAQGVLLGRLVLAPPAEVPYAAAPPATPQPTPVATPGLPPLGGGSFPPISKE